jgi:phosphoribosyl 1,2-cyclic phosphodiesterase
LIISYTPGAVNEFQKADRPLSIALASLALTKQGGGITLKMGAGEELILYFLGTRGGIKARSPRHFMNSCLRVSAGRTTVVFDRGEDWLGRRSLFRPDAVFLSHAHPDHAGGLKDGGPWRCPVYASPDSWEILKRYRIRDRRMIVLNEPVRIGPLLVEAFPLVHSPRAPAVGYRVSAGKAAFFYAPDLVEIWHRPAALAGVLLYVGDGASFKRSLIRIIEGRPAGHISIAVQIGWCAEERVPRAIFTHCGSQIVAGDEARVLSRMRDLGIEKRVQVSLAHDGLRLNLRRKARARRQTGSA